MASAHPARHSQNAVSGNTRRMASGAALASTASSAAAENIEYGVAGGCGITLSCIRTVSTFSSRQASVIAAASARSSMI